MAYYITETCIDVKDKACVEVCPVECILVDPERPESQEILMDRFRLLTGGSTHSN